MWERLVLEEVGGDGITEVGWRSGQYWRRLEEKVVLEEVGQEGSTTGRVGGEGSSGGG